MPCLQKIWQCSMVLAATVVQAACSESCQEASRGDASELLQARVEVSTPDALPSRHTRSGIERFVYVNLETSEERRHQMERHLASLGVTPHRFPAVAFDANAHGVYSTRDRQILREAFDDWSCLHEGGACKADEVCCWGLADALQMTFHKNSAGSTYRRTRGTSALGNLVSHILALKQIQQDHEKSGNAVPIILMEDDVRLHGNWDQGIAKALEMAGDFDIIKVFSVVESGATAAELAQCESHCGTLESGVSQCVMRATTGPCVFWSTGALLVNPSKVGKILAAFETTNKRRASDVWERRIKRFSIDHLMNEPADGGMLDLFVMRPSTAFVDAALDNTSTFVSG